MKYLLTVEIDNTATADAVRQLVEGLSDCEVLDWEYRSDMVFVKEDADDG